MFEITASPSWVFPLFIFFSPIVFLVSLSVEGYIFKKKNKDTKNIGSISVKTFILSIALCFIVGFSGVFSTEYTGDNPVNASGIEDKPFINVKEFHLEEKVKDAINADSLMFEKPETGLSDRDMFKILQKGDFLNFTALKEDTKVNGSVYFTKESMVVIIEDESAVKDKVVVPAK